MLVGWRTLVWTSVLAWLWCGRVGCEVGQDEDYTMAYVNLSYVDPTSMKTVSVKEELGKFSVGRVAEASGLLVHWTHRNGSVNYGCDRAGVAPPKEAWIALVKRGGGCSYAKKIDNAARHNATAVVIYDDRQGTTVKMPYPGAGYKMVAIFIPQENGERMADMVDNGTRVYMYITVGTHQAVRYANISRTSVLFVSISFIVLMIISLAWLIFYYVQRFRYINAKDQLARRLCSAAKKALSKIPLKTIKDTDAESECCAVCIEPYKVSDVVRILPCKHQFHKSCIDPWLLDQRTCPMCKMDILKFYGLVFAGSEESILQIDIDEGALRVNLETEESAALPSRNSQQTSQAACCPTAGSAPLPAGNAASIPRSQNSQDAAAAKTGQPAGLATASSSESEGESDHVCQPKAIDCIKITMLENSPMTTRMLNRNKMLDNRCAPPRVAEDACPEPSGQAVEKCDVPQPENGDQEMDCCGDSDATPALATTTEDEAEPETEEPEEHPEDGVPAEVQSPSLDVLRNDNIDSEDQCGDDNGSRDGNTGNDGAST